MKKNILLTLLMMYSLNSLGNVIQGDQITAKRFNESTFGVGDIKQSLLTETEFQSQFGTCWV